MNKPTGTPIRGGTLYIIPDTAQVTVDTTLRIGAGNIWEENFSTKNNEQQQRLTAGLWFFVHEKPELNRHVRVHEGQIVEVAGYTVHVLSIEEDISVSVSVVSPDKPSRTGDD